MRAGRSRSRRPRPTLARRGMVAALVLFVLAGCGQGQPAPGSEDTAGDPGRFAVSVDVDTPELRAAKQAAGIEDCPTPAGEGPAASDPLPGVTLACLGGGPDVDLAALRGPMVVNLWAQWCGPCREELPFYQQLHERAGNQVAVLGIDYQDTRPAWAIDLLRETGVTYPSLADPAGDLRVPFRVRGLPGIVFVDEGGSVVAVEYLVIESYDQLAGLVGEHLGVDVGTAG